jgi:hypothetical protein
MKKITLMLFALVAFCWQSNAQLSEGFDDAGLPVGWTETELVGADANWASGVANNQNSTIQPRTGAGMAYFYEGSYNGETTRLESPSQDLTSLTTPLLTLYYTQVDWGGDQDQLSVWYKDGVAGTWTMLQEFTGSVTSWTEVSIILPSASADYYIGLQGFSGYGRGVTVDDVSITEAPSCLAPGTLGVSITSTTTATLNWLAAGSEIDFTYEYGTTGYIQGTEQIGGMAVVGMSSGDITGLTVGTDYEFYVQSNCGADGDSVFSGPFSWTQPDMGASCGTAFVASIEADCDTATPLTLDFNGAPANNSTSCDTFNNYGWWVTTTTDATGGLRVNASAAVDMAIFDACGGSEIECYGNGIVPNIDVILTPNTTYYMYFWQEGAFSTAIVDVCMTLPPSCLEPSGLAASTSGLETVDFTWTAGNTETEWTYEYGVSPYAQGDGGTSGTVITDPMLSLSGLTSGETYDIFIQANCAGSDSAYITTSWTQPVIGAICETAIGVAALPYNTSDDTANYGDDYTGSPGAISCGTSSSYLNGDDVVYAYTATADATINVAMSAIGNAYSGVFVYTDCANIGTECVAGFGNGSSTDDYSLEVSVTNGTTYYVVISTWASPQSTTYTLDITEIACTAPTFDTATIVESCNPDGSGTFTVDIIVTDAGDGNSVIDDGITTYAVTVGTITIGPYNSGDSIDILLDNTADDACDFVFGTFAFTCPQPPPANDDCLAATALTAGAVYGDNPQDGTLIGATDSGFTNSCGGSATNDVWYTVVVPSSGDLTIETGADVATGTTGNDTAMEIYTSDTDCTGVFTSVDCDDDGAATGAYSSMELTGLTAGETLYIRVWGFGDDEFEPFSISAFSASLSVDTLENQAAFTYFPNPVKNTLTLNAQNTIENLTVYNMLGQVVLKATPNSISSDLDTSSLQTGTYFVQVTIANVTKTVRVIKQ